ncbi:MAG: FKBP-type peptidyl-prolyl cis-trans isomerase [archaeon]
MKLKKNDFVEIEYTGKLDDDTVFDTTDEETANKSGLKRENSIFGPVVVCLGEHHVLEGIENELIGKEAGTYHVDLSAEKAFGKKDAKLLKLMPMKLFIKQKIQPFVGLEVNIDNAYGTVRSVSGGRVIVDFNHPLSGRAVKYDIKVNRLVEDTLTKAKSLFKNELNISDIKFELADGVLVIDEEKFPVEVLAGVKKRITELIPEIKDIVKKTKAAATEQKKEPEEKSA